MTAAEAILSYLLIDRSDWWASELQTVTGFHVSEYRDLANRIKDPAYALEAEDRGLLNGAAIGLIYCDPLYLEANSTKALFGENWVERVEEFMKLMGT